jgi:serine carboxypeptidase-like clade 1
MPLHYLGNYNCVLMCRYIGVGEGAKVQIFYYFVESQRNPFDPILLWFVGGPGCSALSAFFFENGKSSLHLILNYFYDCFFKCE